MFRIDASDITRFGSELGELGRKLSDLTGFHRSFAAKDLSDAVRRVFDTASWPPLSPAYRRQKSKTHPGKPILRRDDAYFAAATEVGHPGNLLHAGRRELVYGVRGSYFEGIAGYNYPFGHEEGLGALPERPVFRTLAIDPQTETLYATALEAWARDVIEDVF